LANSFSGLFAAQFRCSINEVSSVFIDKSEPVV